jgi:hypothetical protein
LTFSQKPASVPFLSQLNPVYNQFLWYILLLRYQLRLCLINGLFIITFLDLILYAFVVSLCLLDALSI